MPTQAARVYTFSWYTVSIVSVHRYYGLTGREYIVVRRFVVFFDHFQKPRLSVISVIELLTTSPSFWGPNQSVARFSTRPQNFRRLHFTASSCCVRCIDTGGPLVPSAVPQVVAGAAFGWARPPPHGMPSPTRDEEPTNLFALWTPRSTHIRTHKGQGGLYFLPSRSKFPMDEMEKRQKILLAENGFSFFCNIP